MHFTAIHRWGLLAAIGGLGGLTANAQTARPGNNPWRDTPAAQTAARASAWGRQLTAYRAVEADAAALANTLAAAPLENTGAAGVILELPAPDGGTARFRLVESPVMEAPLAARFPQIRTYAGVGLDDPTARLRCDLTPRGFHAQVLTGDAAQDFKIDPVDENQPARGLVSYRLTAEQPTAVPPGTICQELTGPGTAPGPITNSGPTGQRVQASVGTALRTYRWAVAASGEYTTSQGGTVSGALASITTMANRVSGIFEYEVAVRLVLVANETDIIYTDAATDPYTGGNKSTMLDQNRTVLDNVIGTANYDLGHVVDNANVGGVAYLSSVCNVSLKGGGVSGLTPPTGTSFERVVAHETGHQFSARHTFSGTTGSCTPANPTSGWEPGSGSTIMAYGGLCSSDNVAGYQSSGYFHGGSVEQMANYVVGSGACFTTAATGNTAPTVSVTASKSIPTGTPFRLTATGADADGDALTYNWEQMDIGSGTLVTSSTVQTPGSTMPLFRSWLATSSPTRYFPRLSDVIANTTVAGEVLPTEARTMSFRCTVRDQHLSSALGRVVGGINQSSTVTLTVVNTGAAFTLTAPNTAVSLPGGALTTVTWNVAGTTANGINCANVNIRLSTDGGNTYPITLATATANDGSEAVAIPNLATTTARVMVEAADNYFFDISNANFTITATSAPIISSFSPTSGGAGTSVTLTGSNFTGATAVRFNGVDATGFTVNSATSITATVPGGTATGPISVVAPSGLGLSTTSFTITGQATITSFSPTSGQAGTVVTLTGTGFSTASAVLFNGVNAPTFTVNSATSITVTVPAGASTGAISVVNTNGTGASGAFFTVPTVPTITGFTPTSGATGVSVTVTGTDFTGATNFSFNGTSATFTVVNNTTLTTTVPAGALSGPLSITTPLGTGTSTAIFTTTNPPANDLCTAQNLPVLPCGGSVTGTTVGATTTGDPTGTCTTSVDGGGVFYRFTGTGGAVTLTTCSQTTNYDSKLFVFTGSCGNYTCVGGNDDSNCTPNTSGTTSAVTFTSVAGTNYIVFVAGYSSEVGSFTLSATCTPSTVASLAPASGPVGTSVNITGSLLSTASSVRFNGTSASFTVNTATSITAIVPAGATTGTVAVTTAASTATSANAFTVLLPPVINAQTLNVAENAASGTVIGTVAASDPNAGETLTYSITAGNTGGLFAINAATGELTVASAILDFETTPSYALTVRVTDNGSPSQNTSATVTVSVTNVVEAPTVANFSPGSGAVGTTVTISGTNFQGAGAVTVKFNTTTATSVTVNSATSLTAVVPAGASTGLISVTNADGTGTSATNFVIPTGPLPTVSSFTPSSGVTGVSVTVTGTNFTGATAVAFNGAPATSFTVNSATSITATVPANASTGKISVTTANGTGQSAATFKVLPTFTSFSPAAAMPGAVVTLTGTGFSGTTSVKFGTITTASFTVVNPTTITVVVPPTAISGKLAVVSAGGTATSAAIFTVGPSVTNFIPAQGAPGSVVLVQGLNFTSATGVAFNGTTATKTYNSTTQLTAIVPAAAATGPVSVTSTIGIGTSAANYTVVSGAYPTITSFTPTANVIAGTSITLTGTNFTGATLVRFNNVNAASYTVNSATSITATVPAGATTGKLYVANPSGMGQSATSLTIIQPPTITTLSPISGAVGSVVLLGGTNLTGTTSVTLNGAAVPYTVNSSAQIVVTIPAGATSGKFSATTIAGTALSAATFTVSAGTAPTITSLSPVSGVRGSTVVVTGTDFTGVTSVKLGAIAVTAGTGYTVNSPTQITLIVPTTATTGRVYVTTSGGGMAQSPANYTVILAPTISSFTPASGAVGALVTINGTNFTGATSVTFGTMATTTFTLVSANKITVNVPSGATTGTLKVTNAAGTATSAGTFTVTGTRAPALAAAETLAEPLMLWPNPARETVHLTGAGGGNVVLVDALGRTVLTSTAIDGVATLDVRHLPAGVYFVRTATATQRLVITH